MAYIGPVQDPLGTTIDDLSQWNTLGGSCPSCEREGWIDRYELRRKWGNAMLHSLQPRLRCLSCGNKQGNRWILGQLPR
ncbi:hypothetical protein CPT32_24280 [Rhizobium sophoriradicis]|nr:hypothetical protein CPT32_24280 [Rhizobium sophoriradicis]